MFAPWNYLFNRHYPTEQRSFNHDVQTIALIIVSSLRKKFMFYRLRLAATHISSCSSLTLLYSKASFVAMSTFTLPNSNPEISVHLTSDLSQEQLLSFPAFKTWITTLQRSLLTQQNKSHTFHSAPYKLRKIQIQSVDFFGSQRIGFIKLKTVVSNDKGEKLPGSVFVSTLFRVPISPLRQCLSLEACRAECSPSKRVPRVRLPIK